FVCVLVSVYWRHWGPKNFLWFSDIALLVTVIALWLESALLASMMTLAVALPEAAWDADFFGRLASGRDIFGLSASMFYTPFTAYLRALSLFHVFLPLMLIWMVHRLGYDRRAWLFQTIAALVVLPVTYALTDSADNVNWVYGPGRKPQRRLRPLTYLGVSMLFFPLVIYLPSHLLLRAWLGGG